MRVFLVVSLFLPQFLFAGVQYVEIHNDTNDQLCLNYIKGNTIITPQPNFIKSHTKSGVISLDNEAYPIPGPTNAVIRIVGCMGAGPWLSVVFAASLDEKMKVMNCYYPNKCSVNTRESNFYDITIS